MKCYEKANSKLQTAVFFRSSGKALPKMIYHDFPTVERKRYRTFCWLFSFSLRTSRAGDAKHEKERFMKEQNVGFTVKEPANERAFFRPTLYRKTVRFVKYFPSCPRPVTVEGSALWQSILLEIFVSQDRLFPRVSPSQRIHVSRHIDKKLSWRERKF